MYKISLLLFIIKEKHRIFGGNVLNSHVLLHRSWGTWTLSRWICTRPRYVVTQELYNKLIKTSIKQYKNILLWVCLSQCVYRRSCNSVISVFSSSLRRFWRPWCSSWSGHRIWTWASDWWVNAVDVNESWTSHVCVPHMLKNINYCLIPCRGWSTRPGRCWTWRSRQ